MKDWKIAGRTLRKSPLFTLTAVITIALGVGASTAIFGVTNAVLLKPLPYKNPHQLVVAICDFTVRHIRDFSFSNEDFIDMRDGTKNVFQGMAGVFTFKFVLPQDDGTPEQVRIAFVTTNFFDLMGAKIMYGRDFTPQDGLPQPPPPQPGTAQAATPPARLPVMAILSYEYFQRRYGGNLSVIGRIIHSQAQGLNPVIVGVLAPGFQLHFPPEANVDADPQVWLANRLDYNNANRNSVSIQAVGRLKPGVSLAQAQAAADNVAAEARRNFLIERTAGYSIRLEPMRKHLVAEVEPTILALMGAVIFLLLIACSNVANLLLVRASLRERELAVRAAIGATRWHLARQMLAEAVLLAALGAVGGLGLAWAGIRELLVIAPANLPRTDTIQIDAPVLVFTVIAALAAAAIFGLFSAWRASKPNVVGVLGGTSTRSEGLRGGGLLRKLVVVVEVALCFVLLVGSGLMFRSFRDLEQINPGFDPHGLLTFQILGNFGGQTSASRAAAVEQVQEQLQAIPGIQNVTGSALFPLTGGFTPIRWGNLDAAADASKFHAVDFQSVLPGFFETLHIPLLAGRTFADADDTPLPDAVLRSKNPGSAGHNVVVVDEDLAKKAFPHESALGKQILIRVRTPEAEPVEIIGVVAHTREESLAVPGREQIYFTDSFIGSGNVQNWAIRTSGNPAKYGNAIRATVKRVNSNLLVTDMQTADELVNRAEAATRFSLLLIGVFAAMAVVLAAVGLYGVLSTVVRQRRAEIGVRMTLGAQPSAIFKLIVGHGLRLTGIGIAAGLIAALVLTRLMTTMLVGVKAIDPVTFVVMVALFFLIATLASWIPAWRAASVDPEEALRQQ
ncbi:MAG TPA: ABC transporter permease [Candidatus Cybelea sp.]|nr:ABC transporter permease [Candidatus Cybelea sp.]